MFKSLLLFLALSGLQALPVPRQASSTYQLPDGSVRDIGHVRESVSDGFRQGTEPSRRFLVDLNTGLVKEHISEMDRKVVSDDVPAQRKGEGWVRIEKPPNHHLPEGFRQGTEPKMSIPVGFRQGTEPKASIPVGFRQGTEPKMSIPVGFRQGTEPKASIRVGFRQGTEPKMSIPVGFRQGTEPKASIPVGFRQGTEPKMSIPVGFRQGTEPKASIPAGFRQGTEPKPSIPVGFRQGTEPKASIRVGFRQGTETKIPLSVDFRQGTEPKMSIPVNFRQGTESTFSVPLGFRQGTEPKMSIPEGFRQGTEPKMSIPEGFRQGTEPKLSILVGFRQGTEPKMSIPEGFRQGTEPSNAKVQTQPVACKGEIINTKCYEFNPMLLAFKDAQDLCRNLAPNAELASVTSGDLHSHLVSLVTKGGQNNPVLTWLGATIRNQQASWVDGSEWSYTDWMPGHPNVRADKPVCVEMFKIDESWWTAADCELKRASICSYPVAA
ncbi:transcript variant X1 [Nothobranchius furzeri]|uniref:Transcript variant X1 n=1 Tax=Nothobranchius furzeri TaxID=105023 RepID=A0A9D3BP82_NOTFU|nr:transcript variant X1 [Nothobranchius furzeri]